MTDDAGALLAEHNEVNHSSQLCCKLLNLWLRGMTSEGDKLRQINCRIHTYTPMTCTQTHRILGKLLYLGLEHIHADPCCIRPVECFEWKQLWVQLNVNVLLTAKYSWVVKKSFRTAVATGIRIHNLQTNAHYRESEVMTKNVRKINHASIVLHTTKHSRNLIMVWIAMSKLLEFWLAGLYFSFPQNDLQYFKSGSSSANIIPKTNFF